MKKIYLRLIILSVLTISIVVLFYLFTAIKSVLNIAGRNLSVDLFIKKSSNITRIDFNDYKIDDKIFSKNLFLKFNDYSKSEKIEKGKSNIFYEDNAIIK